MGMKDNIRKRRVTYRPSKAASVSGGIAGVIFILLGIFLVIPTFGAFGVVWTLIAVVITGANLYQAFGKKYVGPEIFLEEDGVPPAGEEGTPSSAQDRLTELRALYDQRLITQEEYEEKRKEILREL